MKANELRIGNWVKRKSQPDGFQIDSQSFHICERHPKWYTPIPLTEEWLIKFGFVNNSEITSIHDKSFTVKYEAPIHYKVEKHFGGQFRVFNVDTKNEVIIKNNIKYVHQLQNLYFVLTGEELEIK